MCNSGKSALRALRIRFNRFTATPRCVMYKKKAGRPRATRMVEKVPARGRTSSEEGARTQTAH